MRNVVMLHNPAFEYRPDSSVPVNIAAVAERVAGILGGEVCTIEEASDNPYFMPFAAVHEPLARQHNITGAGDVYGGIVKEPEHADKAMFHELPHNDSEHPPWYSPTFAATLADVVLPGYTTFSPEDTIRAFDLMQARGIAARFKDPSNTGGLGQYLVRNRNELEAVMAQHAGKFEEVGAIIEADLQNHHTVTVGRVDLDGQVYSWHGRPYDVEFNGMTRFGGNELTVVRGEPSKLVDYALTAEDKLAIEQSGRVLGAYNILGSTITRGTVDAVQGIGSNGRFMSGITDPSLRPSASSAAEIRAIEAFAANSDAQVVTIRLTYDYAKEMTPTPYRELFVAHSRMNIFVELVDVA